MPIYKDFSSSLVNNLPEADRAKLLILMDELRSRGKSLPKDLLPSKKRWPLDSRGYFVRMDGRQYNPTAHQKEFIDSQAKFVAFRGSRGCGKSSSGAQKALKKISQGYNGVIGNPDFENLKISTWPEFREWIPWGMVVPSQLRRRNPEWIPNGPFVMAFLNGVRVIVKGIKDPDSARGPNVNWFWYDEAQRDEDGASWKTAVASVRVGKDPQSWATYTPNGYDHWTYEFFEEQQIPEEVQKLLDEIGFEGDLIKSFYGTMDENKENLDPAFMASILLAYSGSAEWEKQQEIYGMYVKREGALGNRSWFDGKVVEKLPDAKFEKRVRYWDLAATEKKLVAKKKINDPDETVGSLMSYTKDKENLINTDHDYELIIEDQDGGFWEYSQILENIYRVALKDGPFVEIILEEEPGSGGKNQVAAIKKYLEEEKGLLGWKISGYKPEGDRVILANYWFNEASPAQNEEQLSVRGLVYLLKGDWNEPFLKQLSSFGVGRHDDKITSVSGARMNVAPIIQKWKKIGFLHL